VFMVTAVLCRDPSRVVASGLHVGPMSYEGRTEERCPQYPHCSAHGSIDRRSPPVASLW
jgi:hypothetical protein